MKVVGVFDSVYGNTGMVADAMAAELRHAGHEVALVNLHEGEPEALAPADVLFVGSPTRFGRMTKRTDQFLRRLDLAAECGLTAYPRVLRCHVERIRGPLSPGFCDEAKGFVHEVVAAAEARPTPQ